MEFERNSSTMKKAEKLYKYEKHQKLVFGSIGAVLIILIFCFLSNFIFPAKLVSKSDVTKIGIPYEFDSLRSFTVYEISYAKAQETLEVVLEFTNNNFDGVDDYYYALALTGASNKNIKIDEVLHDTLLTVIRIHGVKPFDEAQLLFAPKYGNMEDATDAQTGICTINKYNLQMVNSFDTKNKADYLICRIDVIIAKLEKQLKRENDNLQALRDRVKNLEKENLAMEDSKSYLTTDELSSADDKILKNKEIINRTKDGIRQKEQKIETLQGKLDEAKSKKEEISQL